MEMVEEVMALMEVAPGPLPRPGRVSEQRLLSPKICRWRRWSCMTSSRKTPIDLGFRLWEALNRRRGGVRGPPGGLTTPWRGQEGGRATPWCCSPLAPLRLSFGLRPSSRKNRSFGFCFVQFREYFLCSFSETQKQQKTVNWHCGISSID
jgi:hypothetical protein